MTWWLGGALVSLATYFYFSRTFPLNYAGPLLLILIAAAVTDPIGLVKNHQLR